MKDNVQQALQRLPKSSQERWARLSDEFIRTLAYITGPFPSDVQNAMVAEIIMHTDVDFVLATGSDLSQKDMQRIAGEVVAANKYAPGILARRDEEYRAKVRSEVLASMPTHQKMTLERSGELASIVASEIERRQEQSVNLRVSFD